MRRVGRPARCPGAVAVAQVQTPQLHRCAVVDQLITLALDAPVPTGRLFQPIGHVEDAVGDFAGRSPRIPLCDARLFGHIGRTGKPLRRIGQFDADGQPLRLARPEQLFGQHDPRAPSAEISTGGSKRTIVSSPAASLSRSALTCSPIMRRPKGQGTSLCCPADSTVTCCPAKTFPGNSSTTNCVNWSILLRLQFIDQFKPLRRRSRGAKTQ